MRPAESAEAFVREPIGRWFASGSSVLWSASRELCGLVAWGRPTGDDTRASLGLFGGTAQLAPRFDALMDVGGVDEVLPDAFEAVFDWSRANREFLRTRVRRRVSVVPAGLAGFALAGIAPALGGLDDVRIVTDTREGFRALCADAGDALHDEVLAIVQAVRGQPAVLRDVREALRAARGNVELEAVARRLGLSSRSLQRQLTAAGSSFRDEQLEARFRAASELLAGGEKIAATAALVGLTEPGLAGLFRARTGQTPGEYRRALRGGPAR